MSASSEHESEPIYGLPAQLPPGEELLWQGKPSFAELARSAFKLRWVAGYFVFLCSLSAAVTLREQRWLAGAKDLALSLGLSLTCVGLLALLAYLSARSTVYTITSRRVVMRIGVALPVIWNLPFKRLLAAQLATRKRGDAEFGDIVLQLAPSDRVPLWQLWPHSESGRIRKARPCLRALAEPRRVAELLANAVQAWSAQSSTSIVQQPTAAAAPAPHHVQSIPRPLLWAACALMGSSIVLAAVSRRLEPAAPASASALQEIELRFEDRPGGALAVLDGPTQRELKVLAPGSENFVRGVLRGMFRVRKLEALGRDVQFRLAREASGRLTLEDRELGRRIDLDSFGPTNSAAFAALLPAGVQDGLATRAAQTIHRGPLLTGGEHGDYPRP